MGLVKALIGALIGGAIGAAIWAAVGYYADAEIGWIAWGVGVLVGLGAAVGARNETSTSTALLAVVVAAAAVAAGKYLAISWTVSDLAQKSGMNSIEITDDDAQAYMAFTLVEEYTRAGKPLKWPKGKTIDEAESLNDYPPEIAKDVKSRWAGMSGTEQQSYREQVQAYAQRSAEEFKSVVAKEGFSASFGPFDILWALLALGSAYKIGGGISSGGGD